MKKQIKLLLFSFFIIIFSPRLGYTTLHIAFGHKNLTGSYNVILRGFIYSYMIVGVLIFILALFESYKKYDKN